MKKNLLSRSLWMLFFILFFTTARAQMPEYTCQLINAAQVSTKILEFDIQLTSTNAGITFEYASAQYGITLNPAIKNGGTISASYSGGSAGATSGLPSSNQPNTIGFVAAQNCIKISAKTPTPGCFIPVAPGVRVVRVKLTNTVDFAANSLPNLTWSFTVTPYKSDINAYVGGINTAVTVQAYYSNQTGNAPLNPTATAPTAYAVTGGGAYCQGGVGLPVGLANSETGVTYTLLKGGVPQVPTVAGTGAAITFGNQLAGTYTVSGTNAGGTTAMTGNAVITETATSTVETTVSACDTYTWASNGTTYTTSGDYTNVVGCVTNILHLTITPSSTVETTVSACDTYTWASNGTTYTTSGDYTNVVGCVTNILHLTITPTVTATFVQMGPYNQGTVGAFLPTTSTNGVVGTWSPAQVNTAVLGASLYTFTPTGACAIGTTMNITINAVTPSAATWTGAVSSSWFVAGNWNPAVPGAITAVTIPAATSVPNSPTLTAAASCASILIDNGGSFIGSEFLTVGTVSVKRTFANNKWHFLSSPVVSNTFGQVFSNSLVVWAKE